MDLIGSIRSDFFCEIKPHRCEWCRTTMYSDENNNINNTCSPDCKDELRDYKYLISAKPRGDIRTEAGYERLKERSKLQWLEKKAKLGIPDKRRKTLTTINIH